MMTKSKLIFMLPTIQHKMVAVNSADIKACSAKSDIATVDAVFTQDENIIMPKGTLDRYPEFKEVRS